MLTSGLRFAFFVFFLTAGGFSVFAAPDAPAALIAVAGDSSATLSWEPVPGATSYTVRRGTTSGSYSTIASGVTATTFTDAGRTNGTTYYYVVTATNDTGTSANSNQARVTPVLRPAAGSVYWPLANTTTPDADVVRYDFGPRNDGAYDFHGGLDLNAAKDTPVHAVLDGTITNMPTWDGVSTGPGNNILISHGNQQWTAYLHLNAFAAGLQVGDHVTAGQVIGYVGKTGAKAYHLHITYMVGLTSEANNESRSRTPLEILPHTDPPTVTATFRTDGSNTFDIALPAQQNTIRWLILKGDGVTRILDYYDVVAEGSVPRNAQSQFGLYLDAQPPSSAYPAGGGTLHFSVAPAPDAPFTPTRLIIKDFNGLTLLDQPALPPAAPTDLVATLNDTTAASLSWSAVDADSYEVQRQSDTAPAWLTVATPATPTFADSGLVAGTTYSYRVRALNGAGASAFSSTATLTLLPAIAADPSAQTLTTDDPLVLSVTPVGTASVAYQWFKDDIALAGATDATFVLAHATVSDSGLYTVTLTNAAGTVTTAPALVLVNPAAPPPASALSNVSVRASLQAGQTLIVGFVVSGGSKPILVRAAGPMLNRFGLSGLPDPHLELYDSTPSRVGENDDWPASLGPVFDQLGANAFDPASKDAALLGTFAGPHTAHVRGPGAGAVLAEAYDAGVPGGPKLVNVSARYAVGTGDNILIAGFVITGSAQKKVLVRGVGPGLVSHGVADVLADPKVTVFNTEGPIASNDDWDDDLATTFIELGAFTLTPGSKDAALLLDLPPGVYTAQVAGADGGTGEALAEIYDATP